MQRNRQLLGRNWVKWIDPLGMPCAAVLEIGIWRGDTSRWFLEEILDTRGEWIGIDPWELGAFPLDYQRGPNGLMAVAAIEGAAVATLAQYGKRAHILKGRSCDVLRTRPHPLLAPQNLDAVYVDGVHHAMEVLSDAVLCWPLVKIGGVMIFDDYNERGLSLRKGIRRGIDAFLSAAEGKYELLFANRQLGVRKTADITFEDGERIEG